jgi:hypothetical protein
MIYALLSGNTVVALTNDKADARRFPEFELRWSTPDESARYRDMQAAEQQRWWLVHRLEAALLWVWRISFPTRRNDGDCY